MSGKYPPNLEKYICIAQKCLISSRYDEALAHFVCLCKVDPRLTAEIEGEFMLALSKCTEQLEQLGEYRKIVACFQEASALYPRNESLLSSIGGTLFRLGFPDESASIFRKALQLNPDNIQAKQSLENLSNTLVERWHFRMLNDKGRNGAYKTAISKAITAGYDTVLDIGSGSGILSMFAVQAGARQVFACELSKTMFDVSKDILEANKMDHQVLLVNKKSNDLKVNEDIPCRVNLVVTETMDCGLLGEGILKTIRHAWDHLLVTDNAKTSTSRPPCRVIPSGATLYGIAISAKDIRTQCRTKVKISDINTSSVTIIGGDQLDPVGDPFDLFVDPIEPYTTESLNQLSNGYVALSDPFEITGYQFSDPSHLDEMRRLRFELPVVCDGSFDAIAVWFDLQLDDEIHINTSPNDRSICWEQAVFPVFPHHLSNPNLQTTKDDEAVIMVTKGDTLIINGVVDKEFLKLQCTKILYSSPCENTKEEKESCSDPLGSNLSEKYTDRESVETLNLKDHSVSSTSSIIFNEPKMFGGKVEGDVEMKTDEISRCTKGYSESSNYKAIRSELNGYKKEEIKLSEPPKESRSSEVMISSSNRLDSQAVVPHSYMSRANDTQYIETFTRALHSTISTAIQKEKIKIIDHTLGLPVFALNAAKYKNTDILITNPSISTNIIEILAQSNGRLGDVHYGPVKLESLTLDKSWDLFITDLIEPSGIIKHQGIEDIVFARGCLLKDNGLVLPRGFCAMSMCIESNDLITLSMVRSKEHTLGLEIGSFMNEFKVSTQININMNTLNFKPLTDDFMLFGMDFMACGDCDLLSLLGKAFEVRVNIKREGIIHAMPYWFNVNVEENRSISTYSNAHVGSHWKQAVYILDEGLRVGEGDVMVVTGALKESCVVLDIRKLN